MRSRNSLKKGLNRTYTCRFKKRKRKKEKIDQETEGLGTAIKSESLKLGNDAEPVPGILHLEKARGMSELHLRAHSNYNEPEFHPGSKRRKKQIIFILLLSLI